MLDFLIQGKRFTIKLMHFTIDAHAHKTLFYQIGKKLGELAFPSRNNRRHNHGFRCLTIAQGKNFIGYLIGGLRFDFSTAFGAMRNTGARKQQTKVVVNLGCGTHC